MRLGAIPGILALLLTVGFMAVIGGLMFVEVPENNREMVNLLSTSLGTLMATAAAFHFKKGDK